MVVADYIVLLIEAVQKKFSMMKIVREELAHRIDI